MVNIESGPDKVRSFVAEHGNKTMHLTTLAAVLAMLGVDFSGSDLGLARRADIQRVQENLDRHINDADSNITGLSEELKRIRAYTEIVPELRDLLTLRCMGTPNLDTSIDRLKREYQALTEEPYPEPPCERLLAKLG